MKVTIDRSIWSRGAGDSENAHTVMYDPETGKLDVCGFVAFALGTDLGALANVVGPNFVDKNRVPDSFNVLRTVAQKAVWMNDNAHISEETRERQLTDLFAGHGFFLVFVDEVTE